MNGLIISGFIHWILQNPSVIIVGSGFLILPLTSGYVVRFILELESKRNLSEELDKTTIDTGAIIGKSENLLILALVLAQAYTALAVIFAAKSIIRKEDMTSGDTLYYLAGTMVNFTYSVIFSLVLVYVLGIVS